MRLLLDEHLSPALARHLRERGLDVLSLSEWQQWGRLGSTDREIIAAAARDARVLVTYDRRTVPPLLRERIETGETHAGVIFVDERTIRQRDLGGLLRALIALDAEAHSWDWTNRVYQLRRQLRRA